MIKIPLNNLKAGESGIIREILSTNIGIHRLFELGFTPDAEVLCLRNSPFREPVAYMIKGTVIALRHEDSKNIIISPFGKRE